MTPENAEKLRELQSPWLSSEMERKLFREHLGSRLPFVIGITGHINIEGEAVIGLENQIRKQLRAWRACFPCTPFILLSALAEGADRIVGRVATEPEINAAIVAPLPVPKQFYLTDFSEEGRREFEELLCAPGIISLELPLMPGISLSDVSRSGRARDEQYALVGAYIAHHSHVLIALWDGEENHKTGGTADVVRYKLEGVPKALLSPLGLHTDRADRLNDGPVYHFHTPREGEPVLPHSDKPRVLYPKSYDYQNETEAHHFYFERMFLPIEFFNAEGAAGKDASDGIVPLQEVERDAPVELHETLAYLSRLFSRADEIAIKYAFRTRRTLVLLLVLVGLGALGFDLAGDISDFEGMHEISSWSMASFPVFFILAFLMHAVAKRGRFQDNHQDYRALAEGLRVQFFWQLAGIGDSVASRYIGKQRTELYWIRRACLASRMFLPHARFPLTKALAELIDRHWLADQHRYFATQARRSHLSLEVLEGLKKVLFLTGFYIITVLSILNFHAVLHMLPPKIQPAAEALLDHSAVGHVSLMLFAVMSAVLAALIHNYLEKMALSNHAKQYHRMERLFRSGARTVSKLVRANELDAAQSEIRSLGDAALGENGDWVITHRDRPLEVPHH